MISKLLLPEFSIIVRGSILGILLVFSLIVFNGSLFGLGHDLFYYVAEETGFYSVNTSLILEYMVPLVLAIALFGLSIRKNQLLMGFIKFLGRYALSLLIVSAILVCIVIYHKYYSVESFEAELLGLTVISALTLLVSVIYVRYPSVAFGFSKVGRKGVRRVNVISGEVYLEEDERLRIKVYGDERGVVIESDPENTVKVVERNKTLSYSYIDVLPVNPRGGYLEIYWRGSLVYKIKCYAKKVDYKELTFLVYFNDDPVGEYSYKVELYKDLNEASKPVIKAVLAKIGLSEDDLREVQFYSEDNIYMPSTMKISDIVDLDRIVVKLYSGEKYMEFLKDLGRRDVFELWETLVKRLEVLRELISRVIDEYERIVVKIDTVSMNWW